MALTRTEGWERRLAASIERTRALPFRLGEHDCLAAACASIEALTGIDLWRRYRGAYRTPWGMARFVRRLAGGFDFTAAFSAIAGSQPVPITQARRGDIAEYRDEHGTQCLSVCAGASAMVPARDAWIFVPTAACRHAWRIG